MKRINESDRNGFQKMVEETNDCISAVINHEGEIIAWNEKAVILTGYTKTELEGTSLHTLISKAGFNVNFSDNEKLWATLKTKAGELPVHFTVTAVKGINETIACYHITMQPVAETPNTDITSDAAGAQRVFMALHEFQEPVRRILMYADMLKNNPWDKNATLKASEKIQKDANHLLNWIQDMLNYARLQNHNATTETVELDTVMELVKTDIDGLLRERDAIVEITTKLPRITGSKVQLVQLFANLVHNAIKYNSSKPHVTISCHPVKNKQFGNRLGNWYGISVHDNGIGFEPHRNNEIFNLFSRAHGSEYPGYGIGLALCLKIAEAHGGTIRAESAPGKGSVFTVYFPAK